MMSAAEGAGGREPASEEDVRRRAAQRRPAEGGDVKKMVRPSQRREMARCAVEGGRTNIRHACRTFEVSETCYRYQAKACEENARIADWLVRLTTAYKRLGLWAVLPAPAQRQGLWLEPQARLPHLPGAGVEPADQAEEAPGAREARAAGGARRDQPGLVDGLHARPAQRRPQLPAVQRAGRLQPRRARRSRWICRCPRRV